MTRSSLTGSFRVRSFAIFLAVSLGVGAGQIRSGDVEEPVTFRDVAVEVGVDFVHRSSATSRKYLPETMGSGLAVFDFDGDGRLDLYFANGARITDPMPEGARPVKSGPEFHDRLYRQTENGRFVDVTAAAGLSGNTYATGVAVGDFNNDGFPDLFVGGVGSNQLYRNNGDGTFADVTKTAGVEGSGWTSSVAFVDYDSDGLLDLVVGRYLDWDFSRDLHCGTPEVRAYCSPDNFGPVSPLLFRNLGDGRFRDVSEESLIAGYKGKALGIGIGDLDRDGLVDIFIANDGMEQFLLRNNGDGTFEEIALYSGVALDQDGQDYAGMGVDVADYDNDGLPDILVTNLSNESYALYRNQGGGSLNYISDRLGISGITLLFAGWGVRFLDYDNDGWRDIIVVQGHVLDTIEATSPHIPYAQPPFLLRNERGERFVNVSSKAGGFFSRPSVGRGLATGDLDNDGDLDIVVSHLDGPASVLMNEGGSRQSWLMVVPEGTVSNRDGIGAEIEITAGSLRKWAVVSTASSYQSSSDHRSHFGLGKEKLVNRVTVRWPSGIVQTLEDVAVNQIVRVKEPPGAVHSARTDRPGGQGQ
jgi:enediyne biosynthesis protein E4